MTSERWEQVSALFEAVLEQPEDRQDVFLTEACGDDAALRHEVVLLLHSHGKARDFIETPVSTPVAALLAQAQTESREGDLLTGRSLGHYQILEKLGAGGMGIVYRALDTHLDRSVAIKVLPPNRQEDSEHRQRFVREAKSASALNHPNIVTIHDTASDHGVDFIVMEYLPGQTLDRLIPACGLAWGEALRQAVQIADALSAAHSAGIIHRDLKPGNIMVSPAGLVKVLDFGVAKLAGHNDANGTGERSSGQAEATLLTRDGTLVGTDAYMSPEQVERRPVDARSDVFSFGSLLYQMLSGRKAFNGGSREETLAAIVGKDPQPLRDMVPAIPPALEQLVSRCLAKRPGARWQSMEEVRQFLGSLDQSTSAARRPRSRRMRLGVLVATACLIFALITLERMGKFVRFGKAASRQRSLQQTAEVEIPICRVSPDGQWLASLKSDSMTLWIENLNNGERRQMTYDLTDINFAWSRDSRRIAVTCRNAANVRRLEVVEWATGQRLILHEGQAAGGQLAWSPDERHLFYRVPLGENQMQISSFSIADRSLTPVVTTVAQGHGTAISPDGRFVAYAANQNNNWDIFLARTSNSDGAEIRLTDAPSQEGAPIWSPDGQLLMFWSRDSSGGGDLWAMKIDPETGARKGELLLLERLGLTAVPAWSLTTDGELFFQRARGNASRVFFLDVDPVTGMPQGKPTTTFPEETFEPTWSQNGTRLYYVRQQGRVERNLRTGEERVLPRPAENMGNSALSPLPDSITFLGWSPQKGIYEFNAQTRETRLLWKTELDFNGPLSWSPDGNELLLPAWPRKDGGFPILVLDRSGREAKEIFVAKTKPDPAWSPNGREIAINEEGCLKVISSAGGTARTLACAPQTDGRPGSIAWSPDGSKIIWAVTSKADRRTDLWTVDYFSGQHVEWRGEGDGATPTHLQWSPDRKRLVFEMKYRNIIEVWKLSNFLP